MLGKQTTKLIIVCDKKTNQYANYLRQLISANDDTDNKIVGTADGTVITVVWDIDQYKNSSATISSNEHVLFIGENKISNLEIGTMKINFNKHGMLYGWLGKRAMMSVHNDIRNENDYKEFIKFCDSYNKQFDKQAYNTEQKEKNALNKGILINHIVDIIAGGLVNGNKKKIIIDQQYLALTLIFYSDGLKEFLEG